MVNSSLDYYSVTTETPNISLGILLNCLLLFLIKKHSHPYLGNYKYLLALFASYDVYLCILHGMLNPIVMVIGNTFGAALYAPWQIHELSSFYFACFSMPFSLMNIHFLYRFWSVANPARLALFSRPWFVVKLSLYPLIQGSVWFCCAYAIRTGVNDIALTKVIEVFHQTHSATVEDGWLVMDHWRNGQLNVHVLYVIFVTMFIIFGSLFMAIIFATLTYREILKATTLSHRVISIQYTLLIAVCAQTFIPVVCVYIPYFLIIMCPFLGIPGFGLVNNFSYFVSIFPGWDAVVIIILIRDYRLGLLKLLRLRRKKTIVVPHTQFTTTIEPSMHM